MGDAEEMSTEQSTRLKSAKIGFAQGHSLQVGIASISKLNRNIINEYLTNIT